MPPQNPNDIQWRVVRVPSTESGDELSPVLQQVSDDGYTVLSVTPSPQRNAFRVVAYKPAT